jgi:hypothetical protein
MTQDEELDAVKEAVGKTKVKYLRPSECRSHMRRTLAKEFQGIVDGFVEAAKKGSCPHVKLATELLKPVRKSSSRKKGTVARDLERLDKEQLERERLHKERSGVQNVTEKKPAISNAQGGLEMSGYPKI